MVRNCRNLLFSVPLLPDNEAVAAPQLGSGRRDPGIVGGGLKTTGGTSVSYNLFRLRVVG